MENKQQTSVDMRLLLAQISNLDIAINKLVKWQEAMTFKSGSLMISGKDKGGKEFHEILVFDSSLHIPAYKLKIFISYYLQDLVRYRQTLIDKVAQIDKNAATNRILDRAEFFCATCIKISGHHLHKSEMGLLWQCDECSTINTNAEID